jgi:acyl-CoA hydrolase
VPSGPPQAAIRPSRHAEWGVAELFGQSLRERAASLIAIAHPDHRERLVSETRRLGLG